MTRSTVVMESTAVVLEKVKAKADTYLVQFITPGIGSSGYYGAEVLESAANAGVFPVGMPLYVDHPTTSDREERPERSVRDMGGKAVTEGVWDADRQAVTAEVKLYPHYGWLANVLEDIGLSIRAEAEFTEGTIEGRRMPVIEELTNVYSVDFVTRAGRGGKVLAAIESARVAVEASEDALRRALQDVISKTYGGEKRWAYVEDYDNDDSTVIYSVEIDGARELWRESFTATDDHSSVSLSGERSKVKAVTNYVAAEQQTQESDQVAGLTEAEGNELRGQVAEANRRAETAEANAKRDADALAAYRRRDEVAPIIAEALKGVAVPTAEKVARDVLAAESQWVTDGKVDRPALDRVIADTVAAEERYLNAVLGQVTGGRHGETRPLALQENGGRSAFDVAESERRAAFGRN